jgi:hypothetical protein
MPNLDRALQLAVVAHAGQVDKEQHPYILHALRVMLGVTDPDARIAAVLHDVVEDTPTTLDDLRHAGFSDAVVEAVNCLTRPDNGTYADYVVRCKTNALARQVKLSDLLDNSRLDRNVIDPQRFAADQQRIAKYLLTYNFLTDKIDEPTYRRLMTEIGAR